MEQRDSHQLRSLMRQGLEAQEELEMSIDTLKTANESLQKQVDLLEQDRDRLAHDLERTTGEKDKYLRLFCKAEQALRNAGTILTESANEIKTDQFGQRALPRVVEMPQVVKQGG